MDNFDIEQFRMGLDVELEHGLVDLATNVTNDDEIMTGKIALAHLNEFPDYYTRLAKMEKEAEEFHDKKRIIGRKMKNNFDELMELYDYEVPKNLIAQKPACPPDTAKLLVYSKDKGATYCDRFLNIAEYLPKNAVLVFNETKVLPARLVLTKETGGRVKILYVAKKDGCICVMADRKLAAGSKLRLNKKIFFTVKKSDGKYYILVPSFKISALFAVLERYGQMPIPPYIKNSPLTESELKKKYQAIFARRKGSVAAPTASLHFTKRLLAKIKKSALLLNS